MGSMSWEEPGARGKPGCLAAAAASVALLVLAPFVALVRWWRRLRRGPEALVRWRTGHGRPFATIDVTVDVPLDAAARARRELVDALVRLAEHLRRPDDLYHLLWREAGEEETGMVAVGPTPQGLAQRLDTSLSHRSYERRTQLWLTLPSDTRLAELVDPWQFDPEAGGAAVELLRRIDPRWAMESSFARGTTSVVYRLRLHLPPEAAEKTGEILTRLLKQLETPSPLN